MLEVSNFAGLMTDPITMAVLRTSNLPHVLIERYGSITSHGTFGDLTVSIPGAPNQFYCYTAECPWLGNARNISCIPAGIYKARRDTHYGKPGDDDDYEVWELQDVEGRDQIQIHIANFPRQVKGCIAVGRSIEVIRLNTEHTGELGVSSSVNTFKAFMSYLRDYDEIIVEIKWRKY